MVIRDCTTALLIEMINDPKSYFDPKIPKSTKEDIELVDSVLLHWYKFVDFHNLALDEARDINMYLKPLRRHLDDIEQADVPELEILLAPMMHAIGLMWGNSTYYCKPARIIVLLQEIGNLLIDIVSNFLFFKYFLNHYHYYILRNLCEKYSLTLSDY